MDERTISRKELGKRLRQARTEAGYDHLTPVAAVIGVHPDTLANYESGNSEPSFRAVVVLSRFFDRPLEWFFTGDEVAA